MENHYIHDACIKRVETITAKMTGGSRVNRYTRDATIRALHLEMQDIDPMVKHNLVCKPLSDYYIHIEGLHQKATNRTNHDPQLHAFLYNHCEEYLLNNE